MHPSHLFWQNWVTSVIFATLIFFKTPKCPLKIVPSFFNGAKQIFYEDTNYRSLISRRSSCQYQHLYNLRFTQRNIFFCFAIEKYLFLGGYRKLMSGYWLWLPTSSFSSLQGNLDIHTELKMLAQLSVTWTKSPLLSGCYEYRTECYQLWGQIFIALKQAVTRLHDWP